MADKIYKLIFTKDDGSEDVVQFTAPQGEPGEPGKTPIKGTDYFTDADKQEIAGQAAELVEIPDVDLTGYATEEYVKNKIAEAELSGEEVDLSGYAQKSELPTKVSQLENDKGYLTEHQDISGKLDASVLPTAINTALAQAKASGDFKGDPGTPGKDGVDGQPGKDGTSATHSWNGTTLTITSASGTSSADLKGDKGDKGDTGSAGTNGKDGKDGTSVTVKSVSESSADGGSNVVTFSDGKTVTIKNGSKGSTGATGATGATGSAGVSVSSVKQTTTSNADGGSNVVTVTLSNGTTSTFTVKNGSKGSTGAAGSNGADGKTPVKGVDYWTAADKASMIQDVIDALGGTPIFGVVDSSNNIVLTGNLAEGTYTLKYEDADGNVTEIGTLNHTNVSEPTYTNLFDPATASINTRMSGSSGASKAQDGYVMTANITLPNSVTVGSTYDDSTAYIAVPSAMWSGSANIFGMAEDGNKSYLDFSGTAGTTVGTWTKIPLYNQWGSSLTITSIIVSLYVSASAISSADIQDIEIYFNECPE